MLEKMRHGFLVVDASDGFREHHANINRLDLGALDLLNIVRNCVGHNNLCGKVDDCGI